MSPPTPGGPLAASVKELAAALTLAGQSAYQEGRHAAQAEIIAWCEARQKELHGKSPYADGGADWLGQLVDWMQKKEGKPHA